MVCPGLSRNTVVAVLVHVFYPCTQMKPIVFFIFSSLLFDVLYLFFYVLLVGVPDPFRFSFLSAMAGCFCFCYVYVCVCVCV